MRQWTEEQGHDAVHLLAPQGDENTLIRSCASKQKRKSQADYEYEGDVNLTGQFEDGRNVSGSVPGPSSSCVMTSLHPGFLVQNRGLSRGHAKAVAVRSDECRRLVARTQARPSRRHVACSGSHGVISGTKR